MSKRKIRKSIPPTWLKYAIPIFGFLLYANTITHNFTQDDAIVITENQYTQQGIKGIPGLLSKDTFQGFFKVEGKSKLVSGGRYRPLTPIMFAIEHQIFGKTPWIGHLINALLYGLIGWLIFLVVSVIGARSKLKDHAWQLGAITAVLFLAHPIHTEAVANIKGRDEIMAMLCSLGALYFGLKYIKTKKIDAVVWTFLLMFLGLLAKETTVTFLAILPLTFLFVGSKISQWKKPIIGASVAVVLFLIIRFAVLGMDFGGTPMELLNNPFIKIEGQQYVPFSFAEKSATIMYTLGRYLLLLIFPHPLTHDYYPRHIDMMTWADWQVILSFLMYAGLIFFAFKNWKKRSLISYGIFYFIATTSIISNIVFPIGTNMSERFMFMPSLGFSLIVAVLLIQSKIKWNPKVMYAILSALLIGYSAKTIHRNMAWKDNYTLFLTDVNTSTKSAKLLNSVGGELINQSTEVTDEAKRNQMLKEAQGYLNRALEIHPNYKLAHLISGNSHFYLKEYDQAIRRYERVIQLDPNYADGQKNLAIAYREAGKFKGEGQGDPRGAIDLLLKSLQYAQNDSETMRLLGVAYGRLGDMNNAIKYFEKELALAPKNASAYFNLGITYQRMGNNEEAAKYFEQAKAIDPTILDRGK